ncbi:MAG: N-acetylmuramoyl-L-alanine amidase [Lachnospiraceae bacterium]|nr:N-acetylmuramoyl-L-alanine amidase [Lachnospiraceae bacterium]
MSAAGDIYSVYKKTLIAALICAVFLLGGSFAYVALMHPVSLTASRGVQDATHASVGSVGMSQSSSYAAQSAADSDGTSLFLNAASSDSEYLWVPIPDGIASSDITIENHYMDRQLWVCIAGGDAEYYNDNYISGNLNGVSYGQAVADNDRTVLKFDMDQVYEYNTIYEDGVLYIGKLRPREVYDRIVIIDPAGVVPIEYANADSLSAARICQDISSKLLTALESKGIRVYVTSLDERVAANEDSLSLLTEVKPDMYIRIETSYDEDSKVYGTETIYNGTYFIPGFGSVELADLLEANVTTAIGGKAMGLAEAGENDEIIRRATVPAATIKIGYYTNTQENILLNRDDYRTRIADGITAAIEQAYDGDGQR